MAQEVGTTLGTSVGYTIRFDDKTSPETAIKYVTDGILLREASLSDPLLSRYSVIMIDEAHELNCNTEILMGVVKKIRRKRTDLRIIVCSATIDAEAFLDFFIPKKIREVEEKKNRDKEEASTAPERKRRKRWGKVGDDPMDDSSDRRERKSAPDIQNRGTIISIDGRQHPVDILFSEKPVADYLQATVDTALRIHFESKHDDGDILCFLVTGEEIDMAIKLAEDKLSAEVDTKNPSNNLVFLPLYGTLPYHVQSRVFRPKHPSDKRRRVIFATNIAETSVTVPHVSSVIDCGFVKQPYFDPRTGFDRLIVSPISQASARQRSGRAGRVKPGKCYRLYTEASMAKSMEANTEPEILRTNLSSFIIMLKNIGIHNILSFDLMNVPPIPALSHGLETLFSLGAIDDKTNLTKLGFQMSEFPTEPRLSRILLKSLDEGCSEEVLCIISAMQVRSLFYQPRTPKQQIDYDASMEDIRDNQSDHVTYLNLMQMHQMTPLNDEDCKERFVNRMALKRACEIKSQLRNFLRKYGRIEGMTNGQSEDEISARCRKVLTSGLFANSAKLGNDGRYYSLRGGHMVSISTASVLHKFGMGNEYVLFSETYDGSRGGIEARGVSVIEAQWLRELAPHYFE